MTVDVAATIAEFAQRLSALSIVESRAARLGQWLAGMPADVVAAVIETVYIDACLHYPGALALLDALAEGVPWETRFDPGFVLDIHAAAEAAGFRFVSEVLAPPPEDRPNKRPVPHKDMADVPVGVRRSLARSVDPVLIEKLLVDPEPLVIESLLDNRRLRLIDVLAIATRRPSLPEVLALVHANPRWGTRYEVRKALVANPHTPSRIVLLLVPWLQLPDLRQLAHGERQTNTLIRAVIRLRRERIGPEGIAPPPPVPAETARLAADEVDRLLGDDRIEVSPDELGEATAEKPHTDPDPHDGAEDEESIEDAIRRLEQ